MYSEADHPYLISMTDSRWITRSIRQSRPIEEKSTNFKRWIIPRSTDKWLIRHWRDCDVSTDCPPSISFPSWCSFLLRRFLGSVFLEVSSTRCRMHMRASCLKYFECPNIECYMYIVVLCSSWRGQIKSIAHYYTRVQMRHVRYQRLNRRFILSVTVAG